MSQKGSFYIETLVSITLIGILTVTLFPALQKLLLNTKKMLIYSKLIAASEYVGGYLFRWVNIKNKTTKIPDFPTTHTFFQGKISDLTFVAAAETTQAFSNEYKCIIEFAITDTYAKTTFKVWYDENLNSTHDSNERRIVTQTILSEKFH